MKKTIVSFTILFTLVSRMVLAQDGTGQYLTAPDGIKMYYEVKGDGYPIVLVHGFSGTSQGWKNGQLYNELLKAGYKVIMMDLRGNGRSDKPHADAAYVNDAEAKDIMGMISALNIKSYDVVGYSRGSIIAARLLVLDKRVNKTIIGGMGDAFTNPQLPRRIHAYEALMGDTSHHDVDGMIKYIHSQHFDETALALQQKYQPSTAPEELAKMKKPVLIIRGTEDKESGNSETALQQMIPGAKLAYVPGDHNAASKTSQFSDAVIGFIK